MVSRELCIRALSEAATTSDPAYEIVQTCKWDEGRR